MAAEDPTSALAWKALREPVGALHQAGAPNDESAEAVEPAALRGRQVELRALGSHDYDQLRRIELSASLIQRWRHGGRTPGPGEWAQGLDDGVLCQFLVTEPRGAEDRWVGLLTAYRASIGNGHVHIAIAKFDPRDRTLRLFEGLVLFLDYLFETWPLRKVYAESHGFNFVQLIGGEGRFFEVERRLKAHTSLAGRYWDLVTLAVWREQWMAERPALASMFRLGERPHRDD